jgi:hypothetical protein
VEAGGVDPVKPDTRLVEKGCTPAVSGSPGGNAGERYYTKRRDNAHKIEELEVLYPWHPWFGRVVHVHEALRRESGALLKRIREIEDRIIETPAVSLTGLIAQIEMIGGIDGSDIYDTLLVGARNIATGSSAQQSQS